MTDGHEILRHLHGCTGSEQLFRHSLVRSFTYTEGVQFFARNAGNGAYWLLDILAAEPKIRALVMEEGFACVKLKIVGTVAGLVVTDGNEKIAYARTIDFTDCPECPSEDDDYTWRFFIEPNVLGDGRQVMTMMWPSER